MRLVELPDQCSDRWRQPECVPNHRLLDCSIGDISVVREGTSRLKRGGVGLVVLDRRPVLILPLVVDDWGQLPVVAY